MYHQIFIYRNLIWLPKTFRLYISSRWTVSKTRPHYDIYCRLGISVSFCSWYWWPGNYWDEIPWASHSPMLGSSLSLKLRWDASSGLLIDLYRMESSANSQDDKLLMYCRSRIAHRTLSWGTPDYTVAVLNLPFSRTTCCVRSDQVVKITLYSITMYWCMSL